MNRVKTVFGGQAFSFGSCFGARLGGTWQMPFSGPGIGGLAFDPNSSNLYASNLDTGLIHRFALDYNARA